MLEYAFTSSVVFVTVYIDIAVYANAAHSTSLPTFHPRCCFGNRKCIECVKPASNALMLFF